MYDVHLELIGKRLVDFLLVLIELCYVLWLMCYERKSTILLQCGQCHTKFQAEVVAPQQSFLHG